MTIKLRNKFAQPLGFCTLLTLALAQVTPAQAQYTAKEWPEGTMKQRFTDTCGACHDINRVRVGYTPEGWLTVVRMMQNFDTPVPAEDWPAMAGLPDEEFPRAAASAGGASSMARSRRASSCGTCRRKARARTIRSPPRTARSGGPDSSPTSSAASIRRPARSANTRLKSPHTGPHGLAEDKDGNIWFTGNNLGLIGKLDPKTGITTEYPLPDKTAKDPHTINIAPDGMVWFTVQAGNMVGRLDPKSGDIKLVTSPTEKSRPYGLMINSKGVPCFVEFGTNKIASIDPQTMAIKEYPLPDAGAAAAPSRLLRRRHHLVHGLSARHARPPRPQDRQRQGMAVAERAEVGALRHRLHQRRALVQRVRRQAEHHRALRSGNRKIPELGRSPAAATSCATWM